MEKSSKETTQKRLNNIIFIAVAVAVIAVAIVAISIMFGSNSKTPAGTIQFTTNPSVTMIINDKDRVIDVVYHNKDAETLLSSTSFSGKTIKEASQIFVKLCSKAGYIDASSTSNGQAVEVLISNVNSKKINSLKQTLISTMNAYFDENGIIAGAVCNIMDDLKTQADSVNSSVNKLVMAQTALSLNSLYSQEELLKMNEKQLIKHIKTLCDDVKDLSYDHYNGYFDLVNTKMSTLENYLNTILAPVYAIDSSIQFDFDLNVSVEDLKMQINETNLSSELKQSVNEIIDTLDKLIKEITTELKAEIEEEKQTFIQNSQQDFEDAKALLKRKITSYETTFNEGREYYQNNKAEIQAKIKEYRDSLLVDEQE